MDTVDVNERLCEVQDGTSVDDRFAAQCLTDVLVEACDTVRAGGELQRWAWEGRLVGLAQVCGLGDGGADGLWEWLSDIAEDLALEPCDPWRPGS